MSRQNLAVVFGTFALILIGGYLLYATPGPQPPHAAHAPDGPEVAKVTKVKGAKGTKPPSSPRTVDLENLIHERAVPADRPAAPAGAPNVVVIIASTQRRDQWSMYGGPPETTPFLAARAKEGVSMGDALSVAVDPRPAATAILTGSWPHRVGAVALGSEPNSTPLAPSVTMLAERLADAGWLTVGATAIHTLNDKLGAAQGFDWYRDSQPSSLMLEQRIDASVVVEQVLTRVAARTPAEAARPLYLQVAFVDSHKPFKVPPSEFKPFESGDHTIAPYRATVHRVDAAVQQLVEGLAAKGITRDTTLFVVLADHGEGLDMPPEHRKQHGFVLYESAVRIPWIWWGHGAASGRVVDGLASQIDLVPTVLSMVGLPPVATGIDGMDLSAAVKGAAARSPRAEAYADTLYEGANRASIWTSETQCQKDYGSTLGPDDEGFVDACFDRRSDPTFTRPIKNDALTLALDTRHGELVALLSAAPAPEEE